MKVVMLLVALCLVSCGSIDDATSGSSGSGHSNTVMGCSPATGCVPPYSWYGGGYCYSTSTNCHNGGNSTCRQCY